MVNGAPAEEATNLFNRLNVMLPAESVTITQIMWRLRALIAKQPSNYSAKVALIKAFLLLGDAKSAVALAEEVWHTRAWLDLQPAQTFSSQLLHLGLFDHFRSFNSAVLVPKNTERQKEHTILLLRAAWGAGDFAEVRAQVFAYEALIKRSMPVWAEFFEKMEAFGLARHFEGHQRVVREHTVGWQVANTLLIFPEPGEVSSPVAIFFGAGDYKDRADREDALFASLKEYYTSQGMEDCGFWQMMPSALLPLLAGPAIVEGRAAA